MLRDSPSCTSMSAVSMPTPITRANRRTIACGPSPGRMLETLQASILDLPDLITDEPPAHHVAMQLSQRVGRDRLALGRAQAVKTFGCLLPLWVKSAGGGARALPPRRCSRDTATLDAWMTWASMPRALSHRASQKPS